MRARDNPFAAERVARIRYRFAGTSLDDLLSRIEKMSYRGAIVGPEGSGKTTLLEDLRDALECQGVGTKLLFVNDASPLPEPRCRRFLSELDPQELVLLDGADAIRRSSWRLLRDHTSSRAAGLVITSHRPGLLPTLIECSTTPALLCGIVTDLAPQGCPISVAQIDDLYTRHHGNLRTCLRELYDLCAHDWHTRTRACTPVGTGPESTVRGGEDRHCCL
ncbi:MAG: ATP-binding protein [Sedimentisphaerales bacterium]|nr:ATP-binding protein [Sedimentisphaerales bacterium]